MAYYLELKPTDSKQLTVVAFRDRFLGAGLDRHPALSCEEEEEEVRRKYINTLVYSHGIIEVAPSNEAAGVKAIVRISWAETEGSLRALIHGLLDLASKVGAALFNDDLEVLTEDDVDAVVAEFVEHKKWARGFLG